MKDKIPDIITFILAAVTAVVVMMFVAAGEARAATNFDIHSTINNNDNYLISDTRNRNVNDVNVRNNAKTDATQTQGQSMNQRQSQSQSNALNVKIENPVLGCKTLTKGMFKVKLLCASRTSGLEIIEYDRHISEWIEERNQ